MASKSIFFFGSDTFSLNTLKPLLLRYPNKINVITKPLSLIDEFTRENNINTHHWSNKFYEKLPRILKPNSIGLVASFGDLIDASTIQQFHLGLFNAHPSLLPKYRGSSPIQHAILNGDSETGVSLFRIPPIEKFDIGEIVLQKNVSIENREYAFLLADRLAIVSSILLADLIDNYDDRITKCRPQEKEGRSYAKKLSPKQGQLNFKTENSILIDRKVRAFTNYIEVFFYWLGHKVKVNDMIILSESDQYKLDYMFKTGLDFYNKRPEKHESPRPGQLLYSRSTRSLCIKCSDDIWIGFRHLQMEKRPAMSALDFQNGFISRVACDNAVTDS